MNSRIFLATAILLHTFTLKAQITVRAFINVSAEELTIPKYEQTPAKGQVYLHVKPGDHHLISPQLAEQLQGETITEVDLVYTDWPPGDDMKELNRRRIIELYTYLPQAFESQVVQWRIIKQDGVKSSSQLGNYFHGFVIHYRPLPTANEEFEVINRILTGKEAIDSTFFKVFERNKHWKNMLVVADVTGSMSPYLGELLLWLKLHQTNKLGNEFVFFNDDEPQSTNQAAAEDPHGMWSIKSKHFEDIKTTMFKAIAEGSHVENNIEALFYASRKFDLIKKDGIIMIADNWESPCDMKLLGQFKQLGVPVHVIVCGVSKRFNMHYLEIAKETGGSVHTVEADLNQLTTLAEGKVLKFGKLKFKVINNRLVQIQ